jgi:hypothetical protein
MPEELVASVQATQCVQVLPKTTPEQWCLLQETKMPENKKEDKNENEDD